MSKVRTITLARLVREVITLHVEMPDDVDEATVARFLYETSEVDDMDWQPDIEFGCDEGSHDVAKTDGGEVVDVVVTGDGEGDLEAEFVE